MRSVTGAVYADHQPPEADGAFHLHADDRQNLVEDGLDMPLPYTTVLLAHEVTHAQGALFRLPMLTEGIPKYVALVEDARLRRAEGVQTRYSEGFSANLPRLSGRVKVGGRYSLVRLDWVPLLEPEERNAS